MGGLMFSASQSHLPTFVGVGYWAIGRAADEATNYGASDQVNTPAERSAKVTCLASVRLVR
jgi:hypothetical protein